MYSHLRTKEIQEDPRQEVCMKMLDDLARHFGGLFAQDAESEGAEDDAQGERWAPGWLLWEAGAQTQSGGGGESHQGLNST